MRPCAGMVGLDHPLLLAGSTFSGPLSARMDYSKVDFPVIDCARATVVHTIDRWVSAHGPVASGAAFLYTETLGMVIDRMADYRGVRA